MIIECNGINVVLPHKKIIFPQPKDMLDMTEAMHVSKLYQRLATFELIKDNATEQINNIEAWNTACVVRETMENNNLTEEEALEEICPGLVQL